VPTSHPTPGSVRDRARRSAVGAGLAVAAHLGLFALGGLRALLGGVAATLVGGGIVLWCLAVEDRRRQWSGAADEVFRGHGTVVAAELTRSALIAGQLRGAEQADLSFTNGTMMGTLALSSSGVRWSPAWNGRRKGYPTISVPWGQIIHAEAHGISGIMDPAVLKLDLTDGSAVEIVSRRSQMLSSALATVWRPD
jgi:hypothetical protein